MLRYYTDIRFAGQRGPIRQFLIYIGSDRLTMPAAIHEPGLLDYHYGLVDMHQINCTGLLVQDNPDALVLAVLCDFGERDPGEVVTYIVRRLRELLGADERGFRDYMAMLEILSENRDLKTQVEEAEQMLTQIDVERMPSFAIGFERGEARGKAEGEARGEARGEAKGKAEGKAEGKAIGEAQIVSRLLRRLDMTKASELLELPPEEVERILASGGDTD